MILKILPSSCRFQQAPSFSPSMAPAFSRLSCQFSAAPGRQLARTSAQHPPCCAFCAPLGFSRPHIRSLGNFSVLSAIHGTLKIGETHGGALGSAENAGATKKIQSAEEGRSFARFSKSFFKAFFWHVWGSFGFSEQKRFMGQDFEAQLPINIWMNSSMILMQMKLFSCEHERDLSFKRLKIGIFVLKNIPPRHRFKRSFL